MWAYNTWIVLCGTSLLGAGCGLVGSFAVLRGRSLTGDALAHAALPGLCIAFLLVGERSLPAMLAGAFVSALVGINVITALVRWTRIKEDAAIGSVLSVFFGAGVVLSRLIQNRTTTGSKAGLDSFILGKTAGLVAYDVYWIAGLSALCLVLILLLYKEFKVVSFDPGFAIVQGWPAFLLDLLLMLLVAVAVVVGLPAVGVVLIAALLILPGATARLWTERLSAMLALSAALGFLIGGVGTLVSAQFSLLPAGPLIVLTGSTAFLLSLLLAPRRGLWARSWQERAFERSLRRQKLLESLYDLHAQHGRPVVGLAELEAARRWPADVARRAMEGLVEERLLEVVPGNGYVLTESGRRAARDAVLEHRLWELLLTEPGDWTGDVRQLEFGPLDEVLPREARMALEHRLRATGQWPATL